MPSTFSRSMRSLNADSFRGSKWGLLLAGVLLVAWTAWFLFADIKVYEVSDTARLEVARASHPVEAPVTGRVAATYLILGKEVQSGDLLVELDTQVERLQLGEEQARQAGVSGQLHSLRQELSAEVQASKEYQKAAGVALQEARARFREADAATKLAEDEAERTTALHSRGLLAEVVLLRARSETQKRLAAAEALILAVDRLQQEHQTEVSDRLVRLQRLKGEITRLEAEVTTAAARVERLKNEIERRHIRAPVSGRIGWIPENLQIGTFVDEGEKLGAVVPTGELKAVAHFQPATSMGRIRPGQLARIRLEGFPWTQYGTITARVTNVASEIRDGFLRVELTIQPDSTSTIPVQHGLRGSVEVEMERNTPVRLLLRAVGQRLTRPGNSTDALRDERTEM